MRARNIHCVDSRDVCGACQVVGDALGDFLLVTAQLPGGAVVMVGR